MTIRSLPELSCPSSSGAAFVLNEKAVAAWTPGLSPVNAADDDGATITILEQIGYDWWDGTGVTAKRIEAALRTIGPKPVTVLINSPGGNFFEGVTIYNLLRAHPAEVTVQIIGVAASAASVIAMAGDTIEIAKTAFVMTHNTQWIAAGDRHEMRATAEIMDVFDETLNAMFAERTGQPVATIAAWNDAEHWVAGDKAIEEGFADALLAIDTQVTGSDATNKRPALYRVEAALTRQGMPRAERRALLKELSDGTPRAAPENAMPGAGDDGADDGSDHLKLALAHLRLSAA